ncbi:endolytic transglycosylase MltG [bacterium]|nr:endolytic transglycosylase MltG [bacterium]
MENHRKKKGNLIFTAYTIFLSFLVFSSLVLLVILPGPKKEYVSKVVIIPKGATATQIAEILVKDKIIDRQAPFLLLAKMEGLDKALQAGEYELNNRMFYTAILKKLAKGEAVAHKLVIPEGFGMEEIANTLSQQELSGKDRFLELCRQPELFREIFEVEAKSLEGYLFPDTYYVLKEVSEEKIVRLLLTNFKAVIEKIDRNGNLRQKIGLSLHEVITLASIIEKEAQQPKEHPLISSVYHNRLKRGMGLEADPTVLYALGYYKPKLTYKDLKVRSPYNTYLYKGLPPGPIANPGESAILAALNPANTDYLYFVSKQDGTHQFSKTLKEHNKAKNLYQKK